MLKFLKCVVGGSGGDYLEEKGFCFCIDKRSRKLPLFKEKVQSSCIWGLVDIFDFSKGRSNQKLLTNGRRTVFLGFSLALNYVLADIEHMRKVHEIVSSSEDFEVKNRRPLAGDVHRCHWKTAAII
ncbi:hypothetical protein M9H77_03231 [Catharanthus roseus]|uniref:Uncharacterized protein n=1 Tax=Catharanthus roseus TaxID=4058 RepID=A0ACC0CB49_CATRO|nr:hypothetical protein M9H77_03231 [Catharanthus roseus]